MGSVPCECSSRSSVSDPADFSVNAGKRLTAAAKRHRGGGRGGRGSAGSRRSGARRDTLGPFGWRHLRERPVVQLYAYANFTFASEKHPSATVPRRRRDAATYAPNSRSRSITASTARASRIRTAPHLAADRCNRGAQRKRPPCQLGSAAEIENSRRKSNRPRRVCARRYSFSLCARVFRLQVGEASPGGAYRPARLSFTRPNCKPAQLWA